jgi:hypothetical protein
MRKAGEHLNLDVSDLYRPTREEVGLGAATVGVGAALGAGVGALSGVPGWVSQRDAAGQPWEPTNEEEQGELGKALMANVGTGALAGTALMALGGIEHHRQAADERVVEAIASHLRGGYQDAEPMPAPAPKPAPRPSGPVGLLPAAAASMPPNMDPALGQQLMRSLGKAIEELRIVSGKGHNPETLEKAGRLLADSLNSLPADEAVKYYAFAQGVNDPAEANTTREQWSTRGDHVVFDNDSFVSALNDLHRPPSEKEMYYVGGKYTNGHPVLQPEVVLSSLLSKLQEHPNTSAEEKALALFGALAARRHTKLEDHYTRHDYLYSVGHPDKMQAHIDLMKNASTKMGFDIGNWNPYGWHIEGQGGRSRGSSL